MKKAKAADRLELIRERHQMLITAGKARDPHRARQDVVSAAAELVGGDEGGEREAEDTIRRFHRLRR